MQFDVIRGAPDLAVRAIEKTNSCDFYRQSNIIERAIFRSIRESAVHQGTRRGDSVSKGSCAREVVIFPFQAVRIRYLCNDTVSD